MLFRKEELKNVPLNVLKSVHMTHRGSLVSFISTWTHAHSHVISPIKPPLLGSREDFKKTLNYISSQGK